MRMILTKGCDVKFIQRLGANNRYHTGSHQWPGVGPKATRQAVIQQGRSRPSVSASHQSPSASVVSVSSVSHLSACLPLPLCLSSVSVSSFLDLGLKPREDHGMLGDSGEATVVLVLSI